MTPQAFIARWRDNPLSEKAGAQTFFLDLCDVLGVAKPRWVTVIAIATVILLLDELFNPAPDLG